jgi:membrane protein YdbS with pleckstrin-like domain
MTPTATHRSRTRTIVLAVAGALAIAVHIGLGGVLLANSGWTVAADGVLVIVVGKVLLIVLGRHALRRRKAANAHVGTGDDPGAPAGAARVSDATGPGDHSLS